MKIVKKGLLFGILLTTSHANIFANTIVKAEKVLETQTVQTSEEGKGVVSEKINASTVNTAYQPGQATNASRSTNSTKKKIKISNTLSWTIFIPFVIEPLLWYKGFVEFSYQNAFYGLLCITLPFVISSTWQYVHDTSFYQWIAKRLGMSEEGGKENNILECFVGVVTFFCLGAILALFGWRGVIEGNNQNRLIKIPKSAEVIIASLGVGSLLSILGVTIFYLPKVLIGRPLELLIEYYQSRDSEKGNKNRVSKKKSAKKS